ncbi:MAG: hypothetical protein HW415_1336, partial [Deltaproteobacteria bacterium]|nr:hypothetical protein [Deltaproteobacteria bacterium]
MIHTDRDLSVRIIFILWKSVSKKINIFMPKG